MNSPDRSAPEAGVAIRPARADDRERIVQGFRALDTASIHTRFFSLKKSVSDDELRRLTGGDGGPDIVRVATVGSGSDEALVGLGHAVCAGDSAEIAFLVDGAWRGRGIAGALLRVLTGIARDRGLKRLEADVLAENAPMLKVFRRCGLPRSEERSGAVVHVTLDLAQDDARSRPNGDLSVTDRTHAAATVHGPSVARLDEDPNTGPPATEKRNREE